MPLNIDVFTSQIKPESMVLFFGSGATVPSGAPSVERMIGGMGQKFGIDSSDLSLREISTLVERNVSNRKELIKYIREFFKGLKPSRGIKNLPLYKWKSIYTTNYDNLIEDSYREKNSDFKQYSSSFDFSAQDNPGAQKIFKIHGTIEKDIVDGNQSRIIISDDDYDHAEQYRESIHDRLKNDLSDSKLLIIGYSLSDPHIKDIVDRAIKIKAAQFSQREITILVYKKDERRASLFENKGLQVVFGGVDDFFASLAKNSMEVVISYSATGNPLDVSPALNPITKDVTAAIISEASNVSKIFNGWPATYSDIKDGLTFERTVVNAIVAELVSESIIFSVIIGASGVGKTTVARQLMYKLQEQGYYLWEHDSYSPLLVDCWIKVIERLEAEKKRGVLLIDEASLHISDINRFVDFISQRKVVSLSLILVSSRASWVPRIKSAYIYRKGREYNLRKLDSSEIDRLLHLVEKAKPINSLVENSFKGFSRYERRRRLVDRCESDFFVCLKNIFASEKFDDIILKEYASLDSSGRDVYRVVAALQSAGITVHRQLIIRLLSIQADQVTSILSDLSDVVVENTIDKRQGIYGWIGRHYVISEIISRYKFSNQDDLYSLITRVIEEISPTYHIEVRGLREICSSEYGIPRISDWKKQNVLYRMMMSVVPGERVPRHKLIKNLIRNGDFEGASAEIRIFEKDFREDGPVARYKIDLMVARAEHSEGILEEDRISILREAKDSALAILQRFPDNKHVLFSYANLGVKWYRYTKQTEIYDRGIEELRSAESRIGDPEISSMIIKLARQYSYFDSPVSEV